MEISTRFVRDILRAAAELGIPAEAALCVAPATFRARLDEPNARAPWNDCAKVLDHIGALLGSSARVEELGGRTIALTAPWALMHLLPSVVSPSRLMRVSFQFVGPAQFPHVRHTLETRADGGMRLSLSLPLPYAGCETYFRMCVGGIRSIPTVIGYPPARVLTESLDSHGAVYDIALPASRTLAGRLRRAFHALAGESALFDEMARQHEAMQEVFGTLLRTRAEAVHGVHSGHARRPPRRHHRLGEPGRARRRRVRERRRSPWQESARFRPPDGAGRGDGSPRRARRGRGRRQVQAPRRRRLVSCVRGERAPDGDLRGGARPDGPRARRDRAGRTARAARLRRSHVAARLPRGRSRARDQQPARVRARGARVRAARARVGADRAGGSGSGDCARGGRARAGDHERLADVLARRGAAAGGGRCCPRSSRDGGSRRGEPPHARAGRHRRGADPSGARRRGATRPGVHEPPRQRARCARRSRSGFAPHRRARVHRRRRSGGRGDRGQRPRDPPELLSRVFEPFFTTKGPRHGSGLGLAICQHIVTDLGGRIEASSPPGKGALFRVSLPRCTVENAAIATQPARASSRFRVLVVDDEVALANAIRTMLGGDHDVEVVTSGEEALRRIDAGGEYDAILCDLMMPGVGGIDVYERLAQRSAPMARRIVFMTGGAFSTRAQRFLGEVPNTCLDKPFTRDRALAALEAAVASGEEPGSSEASSDAHAGRSL